jgi:hypothetical protein
VGVSAGEGNSYGHPDREALRLYAEHGANVYRTDLNGTIVVEALPTGAYTIRVERGEGAQPPPGTPTPSPVPPPTPNPIRPRRLQFQRRRRLRPLFLRLPVRLRARGPATCRPEPQGVIRSAKRRCRSNAACVNDRVGPPQAVCSDRAFSCSTGSGTCSGHGGVYCWRNVSVRQTPS